MNETFCEPVRDWQINSLFAWAKEQVGLGLWDDVLEELQSAVDPLDAQADRRFPQVKAAHRLLAEATVPEIVRSHAERPAGCAGFDDLWSYLVCTEPQRLLPFLLRLPSGAVPSAPAWILTFGDPAAPLSGQAEVALLPSDPQAVVLTLLQHLGLTTALAHGAHDLEGRRLEKGVLLEMFVHLRGASGHMERVRRADRLRLIDASALLVPKEFQSPATAARVTLCRPRRAVALTDVLKRLVRAVQKVLESTGRPALAADLKGRVEGLRAAGLLDAAEGELLHLLSGYVRLELFPD